MVMMTDGVTNNIFYRTGVRFNVTRERNLHIRHRILLTFNVFPIILYSVNGLNFPTIEKTIMFSLKA